MGGATPANIKFACLILELSVRAIGPAWVAKNNPAAEPAARRLKPDFSSPESPTCPDGDRFYRQYGLIPKRHHESQGSPTVGGWVRNVQPGG
jgi:hypothetical protein